MVYARYGRELSEYDHISMTRCFEPGESVFLFTPLAFVKDAS